MACVDGMSTPLSWLVNSVSNRMDVERVISGVLDNVTVAKAGSGCWKWRRLIVGPTLQTVDSLRHRCQTRVFPEPEAGVMLKQQQGRRTEINQSVQCECGKDQHNRDMERAGGTRETFVKVCVT